MAKYKITVTEHRIFDAFVEADSLEEAKEKAWDNPDQWEPDHESWYMKHGEDHHIFENGDWKEATE